MSQYYNGYVICLDNKGNPTGYTPGKVYKFTNGVIALDNGIKIPFSGTPFRSFKEFKSFSESKWAELKVDIMSYPLENNAVMLCEIFGEYWVATQKYTNGHLYIPPVFIVGKILNPEVLKTHNKNWTEEEVKEADRIVVEAFQNLAKQKKTIIFNGGIKEVTADLVYCPTGQIEKSVKVRACESDKPNETIGMCVATCKLLHKPVPQFILDK